MRFLAEPAASLRSVRLDTLTAIYHRRSGQTHVVAEPLPQILELLAEASTIDELRVQSGLADDIETLAHLSERVDELRAVGLVTAA